MTPGFTGAEIENLVNTAITEAVHNEKEEADSGDFEFARDRIMMGIERKKTKHVGERQAEYGYSRGRSCSYRLLQPQRHEALQGDSRGKRWSARCDIHGAR